MSAVTDSLPSSSAIASSSSPATITPHTANTTSSPTITPAVNAIPASRLIPADMVRLDVLLTTGQRAFYDFKPSETVSDAKRKVWTNWPLDWPTRPSSWTNLRLLHLGTFLDDSVVLGQDTESVADGKHKQGSQSSSSPTSKEKKKADANSSLAANKDATAPRNFPVGTRTVIHLVVRSTADEDDTKDAEQDDDEKKDKNSAGVAKGASGSRRLGRRSGDQDEAGGSGQGSSDNDVGCCCVIC